MASDDNVVKLKHLQTFANGISFPNGDNVVRLKHLVSLASAIADDSPSQQHALSLGSWSAVDTVYSAPIIYNGDGTLSTDIGSISNGVLTVADEDGYFNGTITLTNSLNFSGPTPAFINSISVTPNELTVSAAAPSTAEISITTSPPDAVYTLTAPDAPDWVSIDDTTIIFAPPAETAPDHYLFTVVATTKDDQAGFAVTLTITPKVKKSPNVGYSFNQTYDASNMYATITATQEGNGELVITPRSVRFTKKSDVEITCSDPIDNAVNHRAFVINASENEEYEAQQKKYELNKNLGWKTYSIKEI